MPPVPDPFVTTPVIKTELIVVSVRVTDVDEGALKLIAPPSVKLDNELPANKVVFAPMKTGFAMTCDPLHPNAVEFPSMTSAPVPIGP